MKYFRTTAMLIAFAMIFTLISCDRWPEELPGSSVPLPTSSLTSVSESETITESTTETTAGSESVSATTADMQNPKPMWSASFAAAEVSAEAKEAVADSSGSWTRWPSLLTTPVILDMDMSAYTAHPKNESVLNGITIILDPGHGGKDPGALGLMNEQTIYEKDINLAIATLTRDALEALGATVIMTRSDDSWVSLYSRIAIAGFATLDFWDDNLESSALDRTWITPIRPQLQKMLDINDDTVPSGGRGMAQGMGVQPLLRNLFDAQAQTNQIIFLSIHANSADASIAGKRGLQMYISTNQHIYDSELSMIAANNSDPEVLPINPNYTAYNDGARLKLADALFSSITNQIPDLKQSEITAYAGNFAFLREMNLTNVLIETGFMSNSEDLAILLDPEKQAAMASGIADGVWRYFSE